MIKTIIKKILINIFWRFLFSNISRASFSNILNNLSTYLSTLSVIQVLKDLKLILLDRFPENPILMHAFHPFELSVKYLFDNIFKKTFFFIFFSFMVFNIWSRIFFKLILLPFKLGLISFTYSICGFDVSWFLSIFNFFTINIPYWVYVQYLTLYNNWLQWWNSSVNIKSIKKIPIKEIKKNVTEDLIEVEKPNNKFWYAVGVVTIIVTVGFIMWYFDVFNSSGPGPGTRPSPDTGNNLTNTPSNTVELITITDNQTPTNSAALPSSYLVNEVVQEVNNSPVNVSNSPPQNNPWSNTPRLQFSSHNRFNILDQLDENNQFNYSNTPNSPTGSDGSTETITPSSSKSGRPSSLLVPKK